MSSVLGSLLGAGGPGKITALLMLSVAPQAGVRFLGRERLTLDINYVKNLLLSKCTFTHGHGLESPFHRVRDLRRPV